MQAGERPSAQITGGIPAAPRATERRDKLVRHRSETRLSSDRDDAAKVRGKLGELVFQAGLEPPCLTGTASVKVRSPGSTLPVSS